MRQIILAAALLVMTVVLPGCLLTRAQVKEQESQRETQQQQVAMQRAQAQDLEERMRALNGRIETLEHELRKANADKSASEAQRAADRREYDSKLKVYEEALTKIEQQYLAVSRKLETLQAAPASPKTGGKKSAVKNSFEQAEDEFKKKNYQQAVTGYQAYREGNPKGKHYAEATYKMGVSFQELGMKSDALPFFNEVVEKFPKSKSAEKAKIRLKQLK